MVSLKRVRRRIKEKILEIRFYSERYFRTVYSIITRGAIRRYAQMPAIEIVLTWTPSLMRRRRLARTKIGCDTS